VIDLPILSIINTSVQRYKSSLTAMKFLKQKKPSVNGWFRLYFV